MLTSVLSRLGRCSRVCLLLAAGHRYLLQNVLNLLPDMEVNDFVSAMTVKTSDQMLVVYLSALVRATIALHNLINNKISNKKDETEREQKEDQAEAEAADKAAKKEAAKADADVAKKA